MSIRFYDDAIAEKLAKWIPDNNKMRILKPNESKRLFELLAVDSGDKKIKLPLVALSRNPQIEMLLSTKNLRSFNGIKLAATEAQTLLMNIIPVKVMYQLDIYTKTYDQGDQLLRNFVFKLVNNPKFVVTVPYNGADIQHTANLRLLPNLSDTSQIAQRTFVGQFTRWSIQLELQDAFMFNLPYKANSYIEQGILQVADHQITADGSVAESIVVYKRDSGIIAK